MDTLTQAAISRQIKILQGMLDTVFAIIQISLKKVLPYGVSRQKKRQKKKTISKQCVCVAGHCLETKEIFLSKLSLFFPIIAQQSYHIFSFKP